MVLTVNMTRNALLNENESCCQVSTCAHVEIRFYHTDINVRWKSLFSVGDIAQW